MQIKEIILYGKNKKVRKIKLNTGRVNIICGSRKTGKSIIGDIIDYCLGGDSCNIAVGVVRDNVSWYALLITIGKENIFIARQNPPIGQHSTNKCYYKVGNNIISPDKEDFKDTTTVDAIEKMLSSKLGINENLNIPPMGQTRRPLEANIRHALFYCFQNQNEIAAKNYLFHKQSEDFITQTIKDTIPYFLGLIKEDQLALEAEKAILKRKVAIERRNITEIKKLKGSGFQKAITLISEAKSVGLLDSTINYKENDYSEIKSILENICKWTPSEIKTADLDRLSYLQEKLIKLEKENNDISFDIKNAKEFIGETRGYAKELNFQKNRLESIGLFEEINFDSNHCPFCSAAITEFIPSIDAIKNAIIELDNNINETTKERPKLRKYIDDLQQKKQNIIEEINNIKSEIDGIYNENSEALVLKDLNARRARIIGRISLWLESIQLNDDIGNREKELEQMIDRIDEIETYLSKDILEEKKISILNRIGIDMSRWAKDLNLEHSENPYRLDINKVTVFVDKEDRPVPLHQLGSGSNWVGIHLITYFALHKFFIKNNRPVPNFIFIDQPSQVYYPSEIDAKNRDRIEVKKLYDFMFDIVQELDSNLQLIVVDHADINDERFQNSVVEKWFDGTKLIPDDWIS